MYVKKLFFKEFYILLTYLVIHLRTQCARRVVAVIYNRQMARLMSGQPHSRFAT